MLRYPTQDVIVAVTKLKLEGDDATALVNFWDLVYFSLLPLLR
jgi:hypothetical protein